MSQDCKYPISARFQYSNTPFSNHSFFAIFRNDDCLDLQTASQVRQQGSSEACRGGLTEKSNTSTGQ